MSKERPRGIFDYAPKAAARNRSLLPPEDAAPGFFSASLEDVYKKKYGGRYPGLTENVASGVATGMKSIGVPKHVAETTGRNITQLAEDWTPFGALPMIEKGGVINTGLGMLAALPIVGGKAKKAAQVIEEAVAPAIRAYRGSDRPVTELTHAMAQDTHGRRNALGWGRGKFYFSKEEPIARSYSLLRGADKPVVSTADLAVTKPMDAAEYERRYREVSGGKGLYEPYSHDYVDHDRDLYIERLDRQIRDEGYDAIVDDVGQVAIFEPHQAKFIVPEADTSALVPGAPQIRAYHGSPHSFEKFDISKIGTGEGAQAYGHGLYFAENEGVAQAYADTLTKNAPWDNKTAIEIDNSTLGDGRVMVSGYTKYNPSGGGGTRRESFNIKNVEDEYQSVDEALADLKAKGKIPDNATTWTDSDSGHLHISTVPPRMYEVNIAADPEHFLDWDKPLSEQPQSIQDMARNADLSHLKEGNRTRVMLEKWRAGTEQPDYQATGQTLHNALSDYGANANPELSSKLQELGFPGIRYLDQGSRGTGDGSRNYVVFDPRKIEIVRKYGIVGALGAGLISQADADALAAGAGGPIGPDAGGGAPVGPAPAAPRSPIATLDQRVKAEAAATRSSPRDVLKRMLGLP